MPRPRSIPLRKFSLLLVVRGKQAEGDQRGAAFPSCKTVGLGRESYFTLRLLEGGRASRNAPLRGGVEPSAGMEGPGSEEETLLVVNPETTRVRNK